jgi:hypothetical protein
MQARCRQGAAALSGSRFCSSQGHLRTAPQTSPVLRLVEETKVGMAQVRW